MANLADDVGFGDNPGQHPVVVVYDHDVRIQVAQGPCGGDGRSIVADGDEPLACGTKNSFDDHCISKLQVPSAIFKIATMPATASARQPKRIPTSSGILIPA